MLSESDIQQRVADYLRWNYPDVIFHSDFGSGIKLTMGQAAKQKRLNGGRRSWPDMFIARERRLNGRHQLSGLFLELKREDIKLKKRDGSWATEHIAEQADMLMRLRAEGYAAEFVCGFDEAVDTIDQYLGKENKCSR